VSAIEKINLLLRDYDFPIEALQDVNSHIADNKDEYYVRQQLRYLENLIKRGFAKKRKEEK
jgi:hypothetical protein